MGLLTYFSFGGSGDVATILSNLAARFTSQAQVQQLETFNNANAFEFSSQTIPDAIADAKFNLAWADKHVPDIYDYMRGSAPKNVPIGLFVLLVSFVIHLVWN